MTINATQPVNPGDDLFNLAAKLWGDANGWVILATANGLTDPIIQTAMTLIVPPYTTTRANNGIPG